MVQERLLSLLDQVKPRRALFTTFTFSPNWFESYAAPLLKLLKCERIEVLADARYASESTEETSSLFAGNGYRVIPVLMKNGFFHPKLAYLQGHGDDDVLVVGSGNLTFSGQSQQLEVLDAVRSTEHPGVFEEFADFAELFANRKGLSDESRKVVLGYVRRARRVAEAAPAAARERRSAWLVHTLTEPAGKQLARLIDEHLPKPDCLTVLSPYHDADGLAVATLAEDCGVANLRIGLSLPKCVAPFSENPAELPSGTAYVAPATTNPNRFAHAKIFEFVSAERGCLVMTGSVNATLQSLHSNSNVEVGLVRRTDSEAFSWTAVTPSAFVPCKFKVEEIALARNALDAQLREDGTLCGTVSPLPPSTDCTLEIWNGSNLEKTLSVSVAATGDFNAGTVALAFKPGADNARRARLRTGDFSATGWLNIEYELRASPQEKDSLRAAARISAGNGTVEDLHDIYKVLRDARRVPNRATLVPRVNAQVHVRSAPSGSGQKPFKDYDDALNGADIGVSELLANRALAAAFDNLNRDVSGLAPRPKLLLNDGAEFDDEELRSNPQQPGTTPGRKPIPTQAEIEAAKNAAEEAMLREFPEFLIENAAHPIVPGTVATSAVHALKRCLRHVALQSAKLIEDDGEEASIGLEHWLARYSRYRYNDWNRECLLSLFCAMACCAAYYSGPARRADILGSLKESVYALAGYALCLQEYEDRTKWMLTKPTFKRVPMAEHAAIVAMCSLIVTSQTPREMLEELIVSTFLRMPISPDTLVTYKPVADLLAKYRDNPPLQKATPYVGGYSFGVLRASDTSRRCPACNQALEVQSDILSLRTTRSAIHSDGCKKAIFFGLDGEALKAVLKPMKISFGYPPVKEQT
jgi:hypothetical protein